MSELKDFPTDEDYDGNPEYYEAFLRTQEAHRKDLMAFKDEAGDKNELRWLRDQMLLVGFEQSKNKTRLVKHVLDNVLPEPAWDGKTTAQLRNMIMEADSIIPRWQRNEMIYVIDMYHGVLVEMDALHKKRSDGQ